MIAWSFHYPKIYLFINKSIVYAMSQIFYNYE